VRREGARGPRAASALRSSPAVSIAAVVYRKLTRDLQLLSKADIMTYWPALWGTRPLRARGSRARIPGRAAYGEAGDAELIDLGPTPWTP